MRKHLRTVSLLTLSVFSISAFSQQADRFAYAVTDMQGQTSNWGFLRKIDLKSGAYSDVLLNGADVANLPFDAASKKQFATPQIDARYGQLANAAFGTGVAAVAYDRKNNRLYYTPMFIDQLRYVDLKTMKVFFVTDQVLTGKPVKSSDQGNIVTRMAIASDGNGYAMTNDATQLIQFSLGKKTAIVDLGSIVDDPANNGISIHNSCSSFGGDMIADDDGHLYVFSAPNQVFRIDLSTKVATHLGMISNLPPTFTTNGAAVTDDNRILIASATPAVGSFTVDMKSLVASPYSVSNSLQTSDLANSNLLQSGHKNNQEVELLRVVPTELNDTHVTIYPNPVTDNQFVVRFGQLSPGNYTVKVTDAMGRSVIRQEVNINADNQSQLIKMSTSSSRGVYLVNVTDANGKTAFSTKIVLQ